MILFYGYSIPVHKWVMVKKAIFCQNIEKFHFILQNFHQNPFLSPVGQSMLSMELYKTKLYNLDAKKKLYRNGSKIATLCQKTKSKPHKKKLYTNGLLSKHGIVCWKTRKFKCQKEAVHNWVIVKYSHFVLEN